MKVAPESFKRIKGIEPSSGGWKPSALPLSYIRIGAPRENRTPDLEFERLSLFRPRKKPVDH